MFIVEFDQTLNNDYLILSYLSILSYLILSYLKSTLFRQCLRSVYMKWLFLFSWTKYFVLPYFIYVVLALTKVSNIHTHTDRKTHTHTHTHILYYYYFRVQHWMHGRAHSMVGNNDFLSVKLLFIFVCHIASCNRYAVLPYFIHVVLNLSYHPNIDIKKKHTHIHA